MLEKGAVKQTAVEVAEKFGLPAVIAGYFLVKDWFWTEKIWNLMGQVESALRMLGQ